jgi:hypothetical protein
VRVRAPSWVRPRKATVFANGVAVREREIEVVAGKPTDVVFPFELQWTSELDTHAVNDKWIVCVVTGDGVDAPYWKTLNPYTLAATNPVFVDLDGNGWQSPLEVARARAGRATNGATLSSQLAALDGPTSVLLLDEFVRLRSRLGAGREEIAAMVRSAAQPALASSPELRAFLGRL